MSAKNLTIVVDGGGSGCRLGAFNERGDLVASATEGPANLSLGEEQAWRNIRRGLNQLAADIDESENWIPARLILGLAGSLQSDRRARFQSLLPPQINPTIVTDGHAQLLGACGGSAGACLAVGTGSVLHWLDSQGETGMAGGWGYPIGDEGSGAWLGMQLVNAYLWHRDTQQSNSLMPLVLKALEEKIGSDVSQVQLWSTNTSSTSLASLAPMIVSAADQNDDLANELLAKGADQCARLLAIAPSDLPIFLVGGLATIYRPRLASAFNDRIHTPIGDALTGLYWLSQNQQEAAE